MFTGLRAGLKCCLFILLFPAFGQAAELLRPVSSGVVESFTAPEKYKFQYGLRWQLYSAKRYRIVEIDFDLLNQPQAEFTITPWEGLVMNVKTLETVSPGSYAGFQLWRGQLMDRGAMLPGGKSLPPVNLAMRNLDQMVPIKLVKRMQAERNRKPLPTNVSKGISGGYVLSDSAKMVMKFRTIRGSMYVPTLGSYINVEPIEDDPRYHVIFEVDPDKVALGGGIASPEEAEKARRSQEFYKFLTNERLRDIGE